MIRVKYSRMCTVQILETGFLTSKPVTKVTSNWKQWGRTKVWTNFFWQNSNFSALLPCSLACLNGQDVAGYKLRHAAYAPRAGVLKLCTSTFLMYFEFLNLYFGNQIWKFMYTYFGKFSGNFDIFVLWIFIFIKIVL